MKNDFQTINRYLKTNRFIQIILVLSLILGINHLASRYYFRKDITTNHKHTLNPESIAYLKQIKSPVDIYVTIPPKTQDSETNQIYTDIKELLKEFEYETRNNPIAKIKAHFINPYEQSPQAQKVASQFPIYKENAIIIASGNHHRQISGSELYSSNNEHLTEFKGEQVFTSAILDITSTHQQTVLFTTGHGEMQLDDVEPLRGISQLSEILESSNLRLLSQELTTPSTLDNISLVVIPSPQTAFLPEEVSWLLSYLNNNKGKVIAFLDPGKPHGLDDLLFNWGLLSDSAIIVDPASSSQSNSGSLILRSFSEHSTTNFLIENQLPILSGLSRPALPDLGAPIDERITLTPLIFSSKTSWAERHFDANGAPSLNPEIDLQGPLPVATLAERTINSELGIRIPGGQLALFGNSDIINNAHINALGNKIFIQNLVNFCLNRDDLLNIPPKKIEKVQLSFSKEELKSISYALAGIPAFIAFLGFLVYLFRRR